MVVVIVGAGFIGKHLIRAFLRIGCKVRVLDHNQCPYKVTSSLEWIKGDYRDGKSLCRVLKDADLVYHLVSSTVPGDLNVEIAKELHEDVIGSLNLVDQCIKNGAKKLVFLSSASVYGIQKLTPIDEKAETWPISFHGIHKLAIEKYLWIHRHQNGVNIRVLRLANPYGPGQNIYGRQGFIAIAIGKLIRGEPIIIRDGQSTVRDFIYIDDVIETIVLAGLCEELPFVVNIGSGIGYSLTEVAHTISEISGRELILQNEPARTTDIPVSVLSCNIAKEWLSFDPKVPLHVGIEKTLNHFHLLR